MSSSSAARAIHALQNNPSAKRATVYVLPNHTVKATRKDKFDKRNRYETFIVTAGDPNYLERKFIKACKKAGEPFPVKKVQVKEWPIPRPGAKKAKKTSKKRR